MVSDAVPRPSRVRAADRSWGLLARRARRAGLLGLVGLHDAYPARSWFAQDISLSIAERLAALAAVQPQEADAEDGQAQPCEGAPGIVRLRMRRNAGTLGAMLLVAFAPEGGAPAAGQQELLLDLWEIALFAEKEFEQQQELLQEQRAIVEHITDGLLVVDSELTVKHMNVAAGRILHLNPQASIGQSFGALLDFQPIIKPILDTGEGYVDRELIVSSPQRHLHLIDTAVPIKDRAGRVTSIVNSFREIGRARRIADKLAGNHARYTFDSIIGQSEPLKAAVHAARKAARGAANVLLLGASGVGKEVFAQAIHNGSARADGPFIAINCAALPRDLIESELFGYAPGSFTGAARDGRPGKFEAASGGTIFLDEISELPIDVQAKLLRVLQEREVVRVGETHGIPIDVRVISAANRDLAAMVAQKEFREDLYYRCHVVGIELPSLRERRDDIPVLANHFLRKYSQLLLKRVFAFDAAAMEAMLRYGWPGNVRELENLVERLVNMVEGETVMPHDLPQHMLVKAALPEPAGGAGASAESELRTLAQAERDAIVVALRLCQFNVTEAARRLGVAKPTLYSKIKAYGIAMERGTRRASAQ